MLAGMGGDDWRVRIEVEGADEQGAFVERLRHGLGLEARELADALTQAHLVVSRNDNRLFVYAASRSQALQAREVIEAELREHGLTAGVSEVERWLVAEERWDNDPAADTWEEALLADGYAPWEVRVTCRSHHDAADLAERLEMQGYRPVRRWSYLIVGTETREEAETLAQALHGEVEAGGALVWEQALDAGVVPFTFF